MVEINARNIFSSNDMETARGSGGGGYLVVLLAEPSKHAQSGDLRVFSIAKHVNNI